MSTKARYVGHPDGCELAIPVGREGGDVVHRHIPYNGELPLEINGMKVVATFRDRLLEQEDNWTVVKRDEPGKAGAKGDES